MKSRSYDNLIDDISASGGGGGSCGIDLSPRHDIHHIVVASSCSPTNSNKVMMIMTNNANKKECNCKKSTTPVTNYSASGLLINSVWRWRFFFYILKIFNKLKIKISLSQKTVNLYTIT